MRTALITGSGMVAKALSQAAAAHGWQARLLPQAQVNVTEPAALRAAVLDAQPELVFHAAALTDVGYCQQHPAEALRVNRDGTANVLAAAAELEAALVYFSTDYVFDGSKRQPWVERDPPAPLNAYGESKLAGERLVAEYAHGHIVRTSAVFGESDPRQPSRNFFSAISAQLASSAAPVRVVADQVTAVTYAPHLAGMLFELLRRGLPRVVHLTSDGSDSWCGWARLAASLLGRDPARIEAVSAADYDSATPRPAYSVLGSEVPGVTELVARHSAREGLAAYLR